MNRRLALCTIALSLPACKQGHLQYDFGRTYAQVMVTQADLSRPSVADSAFPLTGKEGVELRMRVTEETTDAKSGKVESTKKVGVQ